MGESELRRNAGLHHAFEKWRANAGNEFMVRVRRYRAGQLRQMLADPERVDLERFNREVWQIESATIVHPEGDRIRLALGAPPEGVTLARLNSALANGNLELHGNYVWRPASGIFNPQHKDNQEKLDNLLYALLILNDPELEPIEKARQIQRIRGFGENSATGLVMLMHPDRFAIRNLQSTTAFEKLGIATGSLETFEEAAEQLRNDVGAEDFIELDLFLYATAQGRVFIADRGSNANAIREQQPIYVAADTEAVADIRRAVEAMYPDPSIRRTCLTVFADAIERAHAISPASWATSMPKSWNEICFNVLWAQPCVLKSGELRLVFDQDALDESSKNQATNLLHSDPRNGPAYPTAKFATSFRAYLPVDQLYVLLPLVGDAFQSFVAKCAARVESRAHRYREHVPAVVDYLRQELGRDLSQPVYPSDSPVPQRVWLFQANPDFWNLAEQLEHRSVGDSETWLVTRYRDEMEPGQPVVLWQSGEDAGIYALGELIDEAFERPTRDFWPDREERGVTEWAVQFVYTQILDRPIPKAELLANPILKEMSVIRMPPGTNFEVTSEQWNALQELLAGRTSNGAPSKVDPLPGRIVKVAPGPDAKYWQECLAAGYICVGWDLVGDLSQYTTKAAFAAAFRAEYGEDYNNYQPKITEKANELWTLMELRVGDVVVANRGTSEVLGIGQVREAGYEWRPDRPEYKHTVRVNWDTSVAKSIPKQTWWAMKTIAEVPVELYELILGRERVWPPDTDRPPEPAVAYIAPSFAEIVRAIHQQGMRIDERVVRRYHLALQTRGFVVLSGLSGTGKTWLAEAYARAVGARHSVVAVAPNWTTNEDLLGYLNPLTNQYHHTEFSHFVLKAGAAYRAAKRTGVEAQPFHLVLDEMNLARVEYYFAQFLSAMEVRARRGSATIDLGADEPLLLPPNLVVIGTVNIDETTHGFADKVHDRAQLIELEARREDLVAHLAGRPYQADAMAIWDAVHHVGPFTFRVLDEMHAYVTAAATLGTSWEEALDEQLLQKVLPKIKGADPRVGDALSRIVELTEERFPLCHRKAAIMLEGFRAHGFASYFD
jgi:hypothetical protein